MEIPTLSEEDLEAILHMSKKGFTIPEITHRLTEARQVDLWNCLSVEVKRVLAEEPGEDDKKDEKRSGKKKV